VAFVDAPAFAKNFTELERIGKIEQLGQTGTLSGTRWRGMRVRRMAEIKPAGQLDPSGCNSGTRGDHSSSFDLLLDRRASEIHLVPIDGEMSLFGHNQNRQMLSVEHSPMRET
jgi:hypothetical protein